MEEYKYSNIQNLFVNEVEDEIKNSSTSPVLSRIRYKDTSEVDNLKIVFDSSLDTDEEIILDDLINNFPSLDTYKKRNIEFIKLKLQGFILSKYDPYQQIYLESLFSEAIDKNYTLRKADIQSLKDWLNTVMSHYYTIRININNSTSESGVNTEINNFDLDQFVSTDPVINIEDVKDKNE